MSKFQDGNYTYEEVYDDLKPVTMLRLDFYVLMFLATVISTFGLMMNNPAVIIGAMLIAPLIEPILGLSFSFLTQNFHFAFRSGITLTTGILLAILVSFLLSIPFISLGISDEVMSRIHPNLMDLFVALATGFLAGYAKVRKHIGGALFGVAVSISLIPPLCVIGIGLASDREEIYTGASLLFLTNFISILFSGILAFLLLRLHYFQKKSLKSLILPGISLLLLAIPLSFSLYSIQQKRLLEAELSKILRMETYTFRSQDIISIHSDVFQSPIRLEVTVRARENIISSNQINLVEKMLQRKIGVPVSLTVNLSPIVRVTADSDSSPKLDSFLEEN